MGGSVGAEQKQRMDGWDRGVQEGGDGRQGERRAGRGRAREVRLEEGGLGLGELRLGGGRFRGLGPELGRRGWGRACDGRGTSGLLTSSPPTPLLSLPRWPLFFLRLFLLRLFLCLLRRSREAIQSPPRPPLGSLHPVRRPRRREGEQWTAGPPPWAIPWLRPPPDPHSQPASLVTAPDLVKHLSLGPIVMPALPSPHTSPAAGTRSIGRAATFRFRRPPFCAARRETRGASWERWLVLRPVPSAVLAPAWRFASPPPSPLRLTGGSGIRFCCSLS